MSIGTAMSVRTIGLAVRAENPGKWYCEVFGLGDLVHYYPDKNHVPNAWWRFMQYVIFGNKWKRIRRL